MYTFNYIIYFLVTILMHMESRYLKYSEGKAYLEIKVYIKETVCNIILINFVFLHIVLHINFGKFGKYNIIIVKI